MTGPPTLGARPERGGVRFRVWAPAVDRVEVVVEGPGDRAFDLARVDAGMFEGWSDLVHVGDRYRYRVDGRGPFPDPASRSQPDGVHGPSAVVDPEAFAWSDAGWLGIDRDALSLYELHVGTFTAEGTFDAVTGRLQDLADLGIKAVQLLPVNDFPGRWGWGYDGASLFAPARCYGTPDDLRRLVDRAHALGLAVVLDVVYNHFGPDGNYTGQFSPDYVDPAHQTHWGPAINLGGRGSEHVREFFFENARHWLREYHFDGFRVDATHAFVDDGPRPFLAEFAEHCRAAVPDRPVVLIAEDHRNLDRIIRPAREGGWDFDGVWADDFHHQIRRYFTGDRDGVFQDFRGSLADIARTINRGWLFEGEYSAYREKFRGTDPTGIPPARFVFCTQNHDRVGNRGLGDRLNHALDPAGYRAATVALLACPRTPMLFMGQEWSASSTFSYFTDHDPELGRLIREGRAREFRKYDDFNDPARLALVPDPQAESTFLSSKLRWEERDREPHASALRLHQALFRLRRDEPAFRAGTFEAVALSADALGLRLGIGTDAEILVVIRLNGSGQVGLDRLGIDPGGSFESILTTEDPLFAPDPAAIRRDDLPSPTSIHFARPGACLFRIRPGRATVPAPRRMDPR